MRSKPAVPVENVAEMVWGALLIIYLATADYRSGPVLAVFGASAGAAVLELYLRRRMVAWVNLYDSAVWTVLLSAMVAVTGGRSSELWPAYLLMSLTAPSLGRPLLHYGLMAANSLLYAAVYTWVNPQGAPFQPGLLALRIGLFFLVIYVVDRSMARESAALERAVKASQDRVSELVSARDAERREMAHDLHDWLGAGLVAPMRKLELAMRSPHPERPVNEALEALRSAHDELRRVMERLHPHLLEQMGLSEALRAYLQQWGEEHGAATRFDGDSAPEPPPDAALAVYRILQEALNNAAKHAGAAAVHVTLMLRNDRLSLTVQDDGKGFAAAPRPGRGLSGMQERAAAFGGSVTVSSAPGRGTTITALIPLGGQPLA